MTILLFVFLIIDVLSFLLSVALLFTNYYYYCILCFIIFDIFLLFVLLLFYKITKKYPLNNIEEYVDFNIRNLKFEEKDKSNIVFSKNNGIWICENNPNIKLNLNGYLFQKAYIKSFVIRNLRYNLISNKRPLVYLFKNKFFVKKNLNLKLVIINKEKINKMLIVKDGYSVYGFWAKIITKAQFFHSSNRSFSRFKKNITCIDEKIYKNYYK